MLILVAYARVASHSACSCLCAIVAYALGAPAAYVADLPGGYGISRAGGACSRTWLSMAAYAHMVHTAHMRHTRPTWLLMATDAYMAQVHAASCAAYGCRRAHSAAATKAAYNGHLLRMVAYANMEACGAWCISLSTLPSSCLCTHGAY